MSAMYSTIAFAASVAAGSQGASYELRRESQALQIFGAFNALGTVMFAFGGHAILLEVQVISCPIPLHLTVLATGIGRLGSEQVLAHGYTGFRVTCG